MIDAVGEARSNADVFGELCARLGLLERRRAARRARPDAVDVLDALPGTIGEDLRNGTPPTPPFGLSARFSSSTSSRTLPDRKVDLFPAALEASAPIGLYRFQPDPATDRYPLALISPASDRTISSTLGELPRPDVKLTMHPDDAGARGARGRRSGAGLQRAGRGALRALRATQRSGRAPSACRRASGGAARATARPARRSCPTR